MQFDSIVLGNVFTLYCERVVIPADPDACWGWNGPLDIRGYGSIRVMVAVGHQHNFVASRVSYLFHTGLEQQHWILHRCGNPPCTNPRHIYDGTPADNVRDRDAHSRTVIPDNRGERHGNAKLTVALVRKIRALSDAGLSVTDIAQDYVPLSISRQAISDVVFGRTWKHVD